MSTTWSVSRVREETQARLLPCINAYSEIDMTEELKRIEVQSLILHGGGKRWLLGSYWHGSMAKRHGAGLGHPGRLSRSAGTAKGSFIPFTSRLPDFVTLMKPRVMSLAVFTALVGLMIAPGHLDPLLGSIAIFAIAAGAGAAGVLNMWYDADIDAVMARTAMRPIPRGTVSRAEALVFGLVLAASAVAVLGVALNVTAAALLAFAIFFYIVVYTVWLKRRTRQNIVIGGAAGALPPVIGWAAATGEIGLEPLVLFLIVFLWTPPHFWALSLNRADEYGRAGVPMLPVVAGRAATMRQILIYSVLLVPISVLPWALGFAGTMYGVVALVCGAILVVLALRLRRSKETDRQAAHRLFVFSISYLFVLFAALLASNSGNRWSPPVASARATPTAAAPLQAEFLARSVRAARCPISVRSDEV